MWPNGEKQTQRVRKGAGKTPMSGHLGVLVRFRIHRLRMSVAHPPFRRRVPRSPRAPSPASGSPPSPSLFSAWFPPTAEKNVRTINHRVHRGAYPRNSREPCARNADTPPDLRISGEQGTRGKRGLSNRHCSGRGGGLAATSLRPSHQCRGTYHASLQSTRTLYQLAHGLQRRVARLPQVFWDPECVCACLLEK